MLCILGTRVEADHQSQLNTTKQLKSPSIIIGQWNTVIGIIQNGYIYVGLNRLFAYRENVSRSL